MLKRPQRLHPDPSMLLTNGTKKKKKKKKKKIKIKIKFDEVVFATVYQKRVSTLQPQVRNLFFHITSTASS